MWSIVDDEAELLREVRRLEGMWKWDFVWVCARLGGDFLEGKYEVDKFIVL